MAIKISFVEGFRSSGDENAMDVSGQLGFERPDVNIRVSSKRLAASTDTLIVTSLPNFLIVIE